MIQSISDFRLGLGMVLGTMIVVGCQGSDTRPLPFAKQYELTRIALNERPLGLQPMLFSVGGTKADGPLALGRVNGAAFDRQEQLWLADDQAASLVVIDGRGNLDRVVGNRGGGPGEYEQVELLGTDLPWLIVYDAEQRRVVRVNTITDSSTTHTVSAQPWQGVPKHVKGLGSEGELIFVPLDQPEGNGDREGWASFPAARVAVDRSGEVSELLSGAVPFSAYFDGRRYRLNPLQTRVDARVYRDTVVMIGTLGADVLTSTLSRQSVTALSFMEEPGIDVTSRADDWIRDFFSETPEAQHRFWVAREDLRDPDIPARVPRFDRLVVGNDGTLWLRSVASRAAVNRDWYLVSLAGEHLGTLTLNAAETLIAASPSRVATLSRDEFNADVVTVYGYSQLDPADACGNGGC